MSGGAYDYFYIKIEQFRDSIEIGTPYCAKRALYKEILTGVADMAKAIEWEDSGDTSRESTNKAFGEFAYNLTSDNKTLIKAKSFDMIKELLNGA